MLNFVLLTILNICTEQVNICKYSNTCNEHLLESYAY